MKTACRVLCRGLFRLLIVAALTLPFAFAGAAMADTTWTQTSQSDFESGSLFQVDTASSPGDLKLDATGAGSNFFYGFYGGGTGFGKYDNATNNWTALASAPAAVGSGGALAHDGAGYIYALQGGNSNAFWRYSISGNSWTAMTTTPSSIGAGGSLTYDGGNYIYAFRGGNTKNFFRYSISGNSWASLANTPSNIGAGGSLAYDGSTYIFAMRGNNSSSFYRYSISGNFWTTMTAAPAAVRYGGALVANCGSDYLYALRGNTTQDFWQYSISGNTWTAKASTPATVHDGGALAYDGSGYIFAFRGNTTTTFWRYDTTANSWAARANAPASVTSGGALAAGGSAYISSGTLTSSTRDTGYDADFGTISWTASVPSGTSVKFQIATNADNSTWKFKGPDGTAGTYYTASGAIWSGHDGDRYIKYRAYLATTDSTLTPVLNDVSITYNQPVFLPTVATGNATSVEETTATLSGNITGTGGDSIDLRGFEWDIDSGSPYSDNWTETGSFGTGAYTHGLSSLAKGELYYYRAIAHNAAGWGYGSELEFLTKPDEPNAFSATPQNQQVLLSWVKGGGAQTTIIRGKIGSPPSNYNTDVAVYSGSGASTTHSGLVNGDHWYYRAWSYTTEGGLEQYSDLFASADAIPLAGPVAVTDNATLVEETTATLNGSLTSDGGEACQYRFEYDTDAGAPYTFSTAWTGSITSGQSFNEVISGLSKGTKYYYRAQVKNSGGTTSGDEKELLTKPEPPTSGSVSAAPVNGNQIDLSWTKGPGAQKTMIRRDTGGFPADRNSGTLVYFDTGTSVSDTGLSPGTTYYYRIWSQVSGSEQWSDTYTDITATTESAPPTTPVTVGGQIYPIDKTGVIAPSLAILLLSASVLAGFLVFKKRRLPPERK